MRKMGQVKAQFGLLCRGLLFPTTTTTKLPQRQFMSKPHCNHSSLPSPADQDQKRRRLISPTTSNYSTSMSKHSTMAPPPPTYKLILTPEESTLRRLFVDAAHSISASATAGGDSGKEPLILRFTGGWVRDKLLGTRSVDIDVGINNMTGYDFASRLSEYIAANAERYGIDGVKSVHRIESNPEKSKHLETATTRVLGLDVDFVNLRSETYSTDSRIPSMEFGTPEEDALRRDSTVNALFYNLHTEEVEDFTGRGLQDLAAGLIRTPLAPKETFADDPLRVLRLIRFSARLGFSIVPEAKAAMQLPEIKAALKNKISRERVGAEVDKMLKGRDPYAALLLIHDLDLFSEIFSPPTLQQPANLHVSRMKAAAEVVRYPILGYTPARLRVCRLLSTPQERYMAWLVAALTPWSEQPPFSTDDAKRGVPAAASAVKEGLKSSNAVTSIVSKCFSNAPLVRSMVDAAAGINGRGRMGMQLRILGAHWKSQVAASLMFDLIDANTPGEEGEKGIVLDRYESFLGRIYELGLESAHEEKPVLSGKEISHEFDIAPGPWMKGVLERLLEHQLNNPGSDAEALVKWARENKEGLLEGLLEKT